MQFHPFLVVNKRHEKRLIFKIGTIHPHGLNEWFSFVWSYLFIQFLSSKGGQKRWLLTFSLHCLCSSTSHLFISRLRLVYWSTLKIANDLPIFASFYAFVIVSLTWLAYFLSHDYLSYINSLGLFIYFLFLSDEGPMVETLDYTIRIGSTRTFLYFNLYHNLSLVKTLENDVILHKLHSTSNEFSIKWVDYEKNFF